MIRIRRLSNGYVIKTEESEMCFPDSNDGILSMLRHLIEDITETNRYSDERIIVGVLPGDKYEGKLTPLVRETIETLSWLMRKDV